MSIWLRLLQRNHYITSQNSFGKMVNLPEAFPLSPITLNHPISLMLLIILRKMLTNNNIVCPQGLVRKSEGYFSIPDEEVAGKRVDCILISTKIQEARRNNINSLKSRFSLSFCRNPNRSSPEELICSSGTSLASHVTVCVDPDCHTSPP